MRFGYALITSVIGLLLTLGVPGVVPKAAAQNAVLGGLWAGPVRRVAYLEGETLRLLDLRSGTSHTVTTGPVRDARWSPDERFLAFIQGESLVLYDGERNRLLPVELGDSVPLRLLEWSPDGSQLLLLGHRNGVEALLRYDQRTGTVDTVAAAPSGYGFWLDDAHVLVISSCGSTCRTAVIVDTRNGQEQPVVVSEPDRSSLGLALSPDRTRLLSARNDGQLVLYDLPTGERRLLWRANGAAGETLSLHASWPWEANPQVSAWDPTGRWVAFFVNAPYQARRLVVLEADTGRHFTFYGQQYLWNPDGRRLLLWPDEADSKRGASVLRVVTLAADRSSIRVVRRGAERLWPVAWVGPERALLVSGSGKRWTLQLVTLPAFVGTYQYVWTTAPPWVRVALLQSGDAVALVRAAPGAEPSFWPGILLSLSTKEEMRPLVGRWPKPLPSTPPPISRPPPSSPPRGADDLVRRGQKLACRPPDLEQAALYALDVLDFLARHPNAPQRDTLVELAVQTLYAGGAPPFDASWLAQAWLERAVLAPLRAVGPPPADDPWYRRADLYPADVDDDGRAEWLISVHICSPPGVPAVYGGTVLFDPDTQEAPLIPPPKLRGAELFETRAASFPGPFQAVALIADLTGDGRAEIILSRRWAGATTDFEAWRVLTWTPNGFRDRLALPWETSNGGWTAADLNGDGVAEVLAQEGGPGSAGAGPFHPYTLVFGLVGEEYVPADLLLPTMPTGGEESAAFPWQRAILLDHAGRLAEAQRALAALEQASPPPEVRPYLLFRLGFLAWLANDAPAAQAAWRRLLAAFPDHPLSQDVRAAFDQVSTSEDLGRACARWAALGRDRPAPARAWLAAHPGWWHLEGDDLCLPPRLFRVWRWPRHTPLADQLARRAFRWRPLLTDHDLNDDGLPDPVGVVTGPCEAEACGGAKGALWAFVSQGDEYRPLLVAEGLPPESMLVPLRWPDTYEYATTCGAYQVADLDEDGHPEVVAACEQRVYVWRWNGTRFRAFPVATVTFDGRSFRFWTSEVTVVRKVDGPPLLEVQFFAEPDDATPAFLRRYRLAGDELELVASTEPPSPPDLGAAIEALFGRHAPDEALRHLRAFRPEAANESYRPVYRHMALYLYGLACEYRGRRECAALAYSSLQALAPDTPWAARAARHLRTLPAPSFRVW